MPVSDNNVVEENVPEMLSMDQVQELIKNAEMKAIEKARKQLETEQLQKDTTELLKSYDFVDKDNIQSLVKAMTAVSGDLGGVLIKCFTDMDELMKDKDKQVEEAINWFAPRQDSIQGTPVNDKLLLAKSDSEQRTQDLNEIVKSKLSEKNKK